MKDTLKVRSIRWHGTSVFSLELERDGLAFTPGDCLALFAADGRVSRPYSLASGVDEPVLRFIVRHMAGGAVSMYLGSRKPGDAVRVSPPFGWFRPGEHHAQRPFAFIATGTGIAPFLSHLRSYPDRKPRYCLYGVRATEDLVDRAWLHEVCDTRIAVSREDAPGCRRGRVTDLLPAMPVDADADYYVCGLDAMIDDVTTWLEARGVDLMRIHRECFFNASYV
jgi:ferredoxin-NADP reductase